MPFTLADLDRQRAVAKGAGNTAPLTVSEQILREKAEAVLARLEKARRSGDPIVIARVKLAAERIQSELQRVNSARGSLDSMRAALAGAMTKMTVS
jgi:hypothetical protein